MTDTKKYPVIEIFGPTLQGEGPLIGVPTFFVRLGGCDFRCSWCDTLYAVLPDEIKKNAVFMTSRNILTALQALCPMDVRWVTISGGNPAMHDLDPLVDALRGHYKLALETQGSIYPGKHVMDTLSKVVVSPKAPSSGMETRRSELARFMGHSNTVLKVTVFDDTDLEFASHLRRDFAAVPMYLSVGTSLEKRDAEGVLENMRHIFRCILGYPLLLNVPILPQLHVLLWGDERGK